MVDFGKRLKKLRQEKRLTQKQLAALIGVRNSVVSFYETGERIPSLEVLIKLSSIFHVSTDYLMGVVSERKTLDISGLSDDEISLINNLVEILRKKEN